ncbi:MAG TPA: pyridoxamine 5'-phosphate oxidase family protein [Novosphingobium sp.]|nr:pyridoxamine 5'-phosphate oxidase family protein [Novosphingobium sp.]
MGKQRDAIRMSEAELDDLFAECRSLQVATIGKDGAPHLTTLWYCRHEGKILFETYGKSQKVVNLRRDPRLAVLGEAGETYDELRGVSIRGRAELVEGGPRLHSLMRVLVDHHFPGQSADALDAMTADMARKRIVVIVHAEKVISWDHRKLGPSG